jgi:hypothetical protein
MEKFFEKAGVDTEQVAFADGRGGNPTDRFTPEAATDLLSYWLKQPQAKAFREMLPVMGVDGSLADNCKHCPAKGNVFAKVGTVGLPDFVSVRVVDNESLGGYMKVKPGQFHVFYLVVNSASAKNVEEVLKIFNDVNDIAAILQEDASIQGGLHRATNNSGKQHLLKARQNKMRAGILGSGLLLALMHPSAWKGNSAKSWPQAADGGIMLVAEWVSARKRKRVLGRRRRYYGLAHHRSRPRALQLRYRLPVHPW